MMNAAKKESVCLPGLAALRLVLLLVVALCLPETRVWGFAVTPQPASGVFEFASPSSVGEFTTATAYDASGSPVAAKTTTGAADDAAKWIWGQNKGVAKSIRQMEQRGWNPQQVTEAIKGGQQFPAKNLVNPNNPAVRYVHPQTGQSVVQDTVTKEIIHFGGPDFKY
jgi:hypothetical protein